MKSKSFKKRLALILTCIMIFTTFGGSFAMAVEPQATSVQVSSASQLPADIPAGTIYELTQDITLDANQQVATLAGTLDGKGHTITLNGKPLADNVSGTIQNLNVASGSEVTDSKTFGSIAVTLSGTVQNCSSTASINISGMTDIGGLVGTLAGGVLQNSYYAGSSSAMFASSLVGVVDQGTAASAKIANCCYTKVGFRPIGTNGGCEPVNCKEMTLDQFNSGAANEILNTDIQPTGFYWSNPSTGLPVLTAGTPPKQEVDKTPLTNLIKAAEGKVQDEYTSKSWENLQKVLTEVRVVEQNPDATKKDVADATAKLQTAIDGLDKKKPTEAVALPAGAVEVKTVADLEKIGTGTGKAYYLANDITITKADMYMPWDEFDGIFDGKGHTIRFDKVPYEGLFAKIGKNAVVQNVHFDGTINAGKGPLGNYISGAVINCYSTVEGQQATGFANALKGGVVSNCYSRSNAGAGVMFKRYGENQSTFEMETGTLLNTHWESGHVHKITIPMEDLTDSGEMSPADMKSAAFVKQLNAKAGANGTKWGLGKDGYPYFGADQQVAPDPLPEVMPYKMKFTPIGSKDAQVLDSNSLTINLGDVDKFFNAGLLEVDGFKPEVGQKIVWGWTNDNIRTDFEEGNLNTSKTGSSVITASLQGADGLVIKKLASIKVEVVNAEIEEIKLFIDGKDVTNGSLTLQGSEEKSIKVKARYAGTKEFKYIAFSQFRYKSSDLSMINNLEDSSLFHFRKPGTASMTVEAKKNSAINAKIALTSEYVAATSVTPAINGKIIIHGRNANDWQSHPPRFNPIYQGVNVEPANASYKDGEYITLSSENPEVGVYTETAFVPVKAGMVTYKATLNEPGGKSISGTSKVEFAYKNPLATVTSGDTKVTLANNSKKDLNLTFTGTDAAALVTEPGLNWTFSGEGQVEIRRENPDGSWVETSEGRVFLPSSLYTVFAKKEGLVTATGTPIDQTANAKAITIEIEVTKGADRPLVDINKIIGDGFDSAIKFIQSEHAVKGYSYGDEWQVMALIRAGVSMDKAQLDAYYNSVVKEVKTWADDHIATDFERVAIAMTAMGKDITNLEGINLAEKIYNHPKLDAQGSNGLMWGLLALDTAKIADSKIPDTATWSRQAIIDKLLGSYQVSEGGFGLSDNKTVSLDLTAMAIQALEPYKTQAEVKTAVDKGFDVILKGKVDNGFSSGTTEAQVLLTLGVIKKDALQSGFGDEYANIFSHLRDNFVVKSGGFSDKKGSKADGMATVQMLQGLDSYRKFQSGVAETYWQFPAIGDVNIGVVVSPVEKVVKAIDLLKNVNEITLNDAAAVKEVRGLYDKLSKEDQAKVTNYDKLVALEAKLAQLQQGGEKLTVKFELWGDIHHNSDKDGIIHSLQAGTLQSWVASKSVEVPKGATVKDVLEKALAGTGYSAVYTHGGTYVSAINKPDGTKLAEFDNGAKSGWKYSVNGVNPDVALTSYNVKSGDSVVWYYVDNYVSDEPAKPPVAQDITGVAGGAGGAGAGNVVDAKVPAATLDKLAADAAKDKATSIDLNIKGADKADKINVELPKAALNNVMTKTDASLNVNTPVGCATLDKKAMGEVVKAAKGEDVVVTLEKQPLSKENKKLLGEGVVATSVSIVSAKEEIKDLNGAVVTISLPVSKEMEGKKLAVAELGAKNRIKKIEGQIVKNDKGCFFVFAASKLGEYALAEEASVDKAIVVQTEARNKKIIKGVKKTKLKGKAKAVKVNGKSVVKLSWTKSKGYKVDKYIVYRGTSKKAGAYKKVGTVTKGVYLDKAKLKKGTKYYYKVRGVRKVNGKNYYTKWTKFAVKK